ncbi:hypothetical protein DF196_02290 [Bifidobacterium callitrichidarum]|uniref:Uncharacterized protein n=2 Tax=Bifidobacterium callitrichidarum TaxID=2052941 RepID=A0A2U2NCC3_9BIFI|nr:hypothetical protein DF196_02290 [Bifidobacterium callitrichidarum]
MWGIDLDARHRFELTVTRPWDDAPYIRQQRKLGLDPAHEWLYKDALKRIPLGCIPYAVASAEGTNDWVELPKAEVNRLIELVREQNPVPPVQLDGTFWRKG